MQMVVMASMIKLQNIILVVAVTYIILALVVHHSGGTPNGTVKIALVMEVVIWSVVTMTVAVGRLVTVIHMNVVTTVK
jgi:hypothetical protein